MAALLDGVHVRRQLARRADAVIFSVPKSGRTWLRVLIEAYRTGGIPEQFVLQAGPRQLPPPEVHFTHEAWMHRMTRSLRQYLLRDQLLPDELLVDKAVVLLARDPRDIMVSLYFQEARRAQTFAHERERQQRPVVRALDRAFVRLSGRDFFHGSMAEFLRSPRFGVSAVVTTMNGWLHRFARLPRFRLVRYEDLRADTVGQFRDLLHFLGVRQVDEEVLARAVAFGSFENMRRLEESGRYGEALRAADPADPESYKVRRGKIGGYVDYLSPDDTAWLDTELAGLDASFGYGLRSEETVRPLNEVREGDETR